MATIQIRRVPTILHRRLKARAALKGVSLSDFLLAEIRSLALSPTMDEMHARLETRTPVNPATSPPDVVRRERDRR
jgi:antitoxin FitA